ncbi:methyltransferase domain-containing protein [Candidatus Roizmanbacteria bacterium]|nr:methyltransferase domain-containing protein [Candidatus Roizmanbacteria bacterium]
MSQPYKKVADYFSSLESKLGYTFVLGGVKHFGYYPSGKSDISEKKAQVLTQELLARKLHLLKRDNILDAGCGEGYVATFFAQKYGCRVTGITITPFEVKKAKELAFKRNVEDTVRFYEMDYSKTNFANNTFDKIYTMESLVHAYDLEKTLKEFKRILKPNGRIAFFEYSMAEDKSINSFVDKQKRLPLEKLIKQYDWVIEKWAMFSLKKMRHGRFTKILKKEGFVKIHEKNIIRNMLPSLNRLYRLAKIPYFFIKLFNLQHIFINATAAAEFFPYAVNYPEADLFRYNITTAQKP